MADTRQSIPTSITIQLDNPVQQGQFGGAVLISRISLVVNNGAVVYQQAGHITEPAIAEDITPEMVDAINGRLARLGLRLVPTEASNG